MPRPTRTLEFELIACIVTLGSERSGLRILQDKGWISEEIAISIYSLPWSMTLCLSKIPLAVVEDYFSIRLIGRSFVVFLYSRRPSTEVKRFEGRVRKAGGCETGKPVCFLGWSSTLCWGSLHIFGSRYFNCQVWSRVVLGGERGEVRGSMRRLATSRSIATVCKSDDVCLSVVRLTIRDRLWSSYLMNLICVGEWEGLLHRMKMAVNFTLDGPRIWEGLKRLFAHTVRL